MNVSPSPRLTPALPEIVLAVGAMALLMLGAYRRAQRRSWSSSAPIALLVARGADRALAAGRHAGRPSAAASCVDDFARFLKILAFVGSAAAIVLSLDYLPVERQREVRISDPDPALDGRHGDADLGRPT